MTLEDSLANNQELMLLAARAVAQFIIGKPSQVQDINISYPDGQYVEISRFLLTEGLEKEKSLFTDKATKLHYNCADSIEIRVRPGSENNTWINGNTLRGTLVKVRTRQKPYEWYNVFFQEGNEWVYVEKPKP